MPIRVVPEELVELDSPIAEFFRTLSGPWPFRPFLALTPGKHFIPAADIYTKDGNLIVTIDLPGVDPEDIHVKLLEGELVVTGERKSDKEIKEEGYYRKESTYGFFERHLSVPKALKETEIKAEYDNGVLHIVLPRLPKHEELPKAKVIPVKPAIKPIKEVKAFKK